MAVMAQKRTEPDYRSLVKLLPQTLFEIDAGAGSPLQTERDLNVPKGCRRSCRTFTIYQSDHQHQAFYRMRQNGSHRSWSHLNSGRHQHRHNRALSQQPTTLLPGLQRLSVCGCRNEARSGKYRVSRTPAVPKPPYLSADLRASDSFWTDRPDRI